MKRTAFINVFILFGLFGFSQPWMTNIPPTKKGRVSYLESKKYINNYLKSNSDSDIKYLKQFYRASFLYDYRMNENGELPSALYWQEALNASRFNKNSDHPSWTALGPFDTPEKLVGNNVAGNGRIDCITFHPTDENTIYVGTPSGGLWKTIDGGSSWFTLTDNIPSIGIADVDLHPSDSEEIYICTGTRDTWWETFSVGILRSTDGGETWEQFAFPVEPHYHVQIHELFINPLNPEIMLAATTDGIYRTVDGGENWTQQVVGNFMEIAEVPNDSSTVFASTFDYYNCNSKIYKSTDAGATFQELQNTGINTNQVLRTTLATTPNNPQVIYALTSKCNNTFDGLYRSTDGGETWEKGSNPENINVLGYLPSGDDTGGQGYYTLSIGIDPLNENHIWVGGVNIWESFDAGNTWELNAQYVGWNAQYVHADIHSFNINPLNYKLYNANDGGIYVYDENGQWQSISNGLEIMQFYRLGLYESDINTILASPQDNGTMLRKNDTYKEVALYEACDVVFDRDDPQTFYCGGFALGYQRTHNGGLTLTNIHPPGETDRIFNIPFEMHPDNDSIVYCAVNKLYKSTNMGDDWVSLSDQLYNSETFTILSVAPSNTNTIYAGNTNRAWVTHDEGENWRPLNLPNVSYSTLKDIEISPFDPNHIWICYAGFIQSKRVYESTNGGQSFTNIGYELPRLPVNCIAHDKTSKNGIYLGTDVGIYFKDTTMDQWTFYSEGLPNVMVNEMEIHEQSQKIVAATYGRGLWINDLINNLGATSTNQNEIHSLKVYPNPAKTKFTIEFNSKNKGKIQLDIHNTAGIKIYSDKINVTHNRMVLEVSTDDFDPGIYIVQLSSDQYRSISKIIVE